MAKTKPREGDSWTKEQYKNYVYDLLTRTSTPEASRRLSIARAFDYYYGKSENRGYANLLTLHETKLTTGTSPFVKLNFDNISPKLKLLMGDLYDRGFELHVNAKNREAYKRKTAFASQLRFQMNMQKFFKKAAQFTGVEFGVNNNLPQNDEELQKYMEGYKDFYEEVIEHELKDCSEETMYAYTRRNAFLDLLVSNEIHYDLEWKDGLPYLRRVSPLHCLQDFLSEDDFRRDQVKFIEAYYIPIPDAISFYGIKQEKMKEMLEQYQKGFWKYWSGIETTYHNLTYKLFAPFEKHGVGSWNGFGYSHMLLYRAKWKDIETKTQKTTWDTHGNMHVHNYLGYNKRAKLTQTEQAIPRNAVDTGQIEVVRHATLLGGDILVDWGKTGNYLRSYRNPHKVVFPVTSLTMDYNNYESVSLVDRLGAIQDFMDYILTKMQVSITTAIDGAVLVDIAKIPDFYISKDKTKAQQNFIQTLKTYRVGFYDSSKDEVYNPAMGKPIEAIDVKTQNTIMETIHLASFLQQQMDAISGINEARQGAVAPRQLSSTTQMGIRQSGAMTASLFQAFEGFESLAWSKLAMAYAMVLDNDEEYSQEVAARIGRLTLPDDFSFQDYSARIEVLPMSRTKLEGYIDLALAQGNLRFGDALRLLERSRNDLRGAIKEFISIEEKREAQMIQMRQQELQAKIASDQQKAAQQAKQALDVAKTKGEYDVEKSRVISDGDYASKRLEVQQKDRKDKSSRLNILDQLRTELVKMDKQEKQEAVENG